MNVKLSLGLASLLIGLSGCATYEGGTADDYNYDTGYGSDSPTFRPGMEPDPTPKPFTLDQPIKPHGPP